MTTPPWKFSLEPARDKPTLRRQLKAERLAMTDRHQRSVHMQEVLRVWLVTRPETSIGAYWPIKGEFDAMPALFRWTEGEPYRLIGLPVIDRETKQLDFHVWYPAAPWKRTPTAFPSPRAPIRSNPSCCWCPAWASGTTASGWATAAASTTARWRRSRRGPTPWASDTATGTFPGSRPNRTTCRWTR